MANWDVGIGDRQATGPADTDRKLRVQANFLFPR
jgi:hypothetical protein